jgi:hypothetical protein
MLATRAATPLDCLRPRKRKRSRLRDVFERDPDDEAVVVGRRHQLDVVSGDLQALHHSVAKQSKHSLSHGLEWVVAKLETEPLVGAAVELEDHVRVEPVRGAPTET